MVYGLRRPRGTYVISARSRLGFESRSRRDRVCASRPPKAVATYLSVRPSSCTAPGISSCKRHPAAHSQFSPSRAQAHDPTKGRRAARRRLGPHGRPSTISGAIHIYKSWTARSDRWLRPYRWPRGTHAISARSRLKTESRSRRDHVCASRPPKAVDHYIGVRPGSCRYD